MLTFEYITANNAVSFRAASDFWITGIDGLSSNEINISETQGVNQIGSPRSSQSVRPRDLTVTGVLFGNLKENRRTLLSCEMCIRDRGSAHPEFSPYTGLYRL